MSPRADANIPANASLTHDGWSSEEQATATCFCGAVQLVVVSRRTVYPARADDAAADQARPGRHVRLSLH